jgi:hypothetical protein
MFNTIILTILALAVFCGIGKNFIFANRVSVVKKSRKKLQLVSEDKKEKPADSFKDNEYKLIKLKNNKHFSHVYNFNYNEPMLSEEGMEDEVELLEVKQEIGFFTGLLRKQRANFIKAFNSIMTSGEKIGIWQATVVASKQSNIGKENNKPHIGV